MPRAEQEIASLKARIAERQAELSHLEGQRERAVQALEVERARYEELESWFNRFEQEQDRGPR